MTIFIYSLAIIFSIIGAITNNPGPILAAFIMIILTSIFDWMNEK